MLRGQFAGLSGSRLAGLRLPERAPSATTVAGSAPVSWIWRPRSSGLISHLGGGGSQPLRLARAFKSILLPYPSPSAARAHRHVELSTVSVTPPSVFPSKYSVSFF